MSSHDQGDGGSGISRQSAVLLAALDARLVGRGRPLFVGIDGRSGVGKSTLAATIATGAVDEDGSDRAVTVIEGDQFYAGGSAATWDSRTPEKSAASVIDWRRQRQVLLQLREHGVAEWHAFDWESENWDSDIVPLASEPIAARTGSVVVLEGAYSCRPELHDLLDLRVLVDVPDDVRRRQLLLREGDGHQLDWDARWSAAEDWYFQSVMPPERFDLVLGRTS